MLEKLPGSGSDSHGEMSLHVYPTVGTAPVIIQNTFPFVSYSNWAISLSPIIHIAYIIFSWEIGKLGNWESELKNGHFYDAYRRFAWKMDTQD